MDKFFQTPTLLLFAWLAWIRQTKHKEPDIWSDIHIMDELELANKMYKERVVDTLLHNKSLLVNNPSKAKVSSKNKPVIKLCKQYNKLHKMSTLYF